MILRPVPPIELHARWPVIRPWCERVITKTGDRCLPDDVYAEVRAGQAALYLITEGDDELGFVVCRRVMDPDGPVLFIWQMFAEIGTSKDDLMECLGELATGIGAVRVRAYSPRGGLMDGWAKLVMHIYEREL